MKQATIRLQQLHIGYQSKNNTYIVVPPINASINSGELTCLLGANGVGKSTLLRTLSAFHSKLAGEILICDKSISDYKKGELAQYISVVLTDKCEVYNMTVYELVAMGRSPYTNFWGSLSDVDARMIDDAITMVGISHLSHRTIHTLSDGERQKAMIAKALTQNTPIIFLDEPTAFLDFPSKVEMMQLLHRLSRETQKTIFLSTHDVELALQIADHIWLMDKVQGVTIGTPEDLALNGSLNNFFYHKGLSFDESNGLFRVNNQCNVKVCLKGSGRYYDMALKALNRNGISHSEDGLLKIEIEASTFIIKDNASMSFAVNTIEEMLEVVLSEFQRMA